MSSRVKQPFPLFQKFGKLADIGGISADREWRQPFLDSQVIEKTGEHARIRFRRHCGRIQYARYRTLKKVLNPVLDNYRSELAISALAQQIYRIESALRRFFVLEIGENVSPRSEMFADAPDHRGALFICVRRFAKPVIGKRPRDHIGRSSLFSLGYTQRSTV